MDIHKVIPFSLIVVISVILVSCKMDPWISGDSPTDMVTITKTTRSFAEGKPADVYTSRVGAVRMSHKAHMDKGMKCVDCHHKKNNPDREKVCAKCHTGDNGYETMHGLCVDCHIQKKEGPVMCKQCH